jgi:hypothetical protein
MIGIAALIFPAVAFAATSKTLRDIIAQITDYLNDILFLLMGVAIVLFVFYVIKYFFRPDANRAEAGQYVLYAVIGFFVILSFWGIVNILQNTFGLQNENNRPASWQSFSNLFPGGGGNRGSQTDSNFRFYDSSTWQNSSRQQPVFPDSGGMQ